MSGENTVSSDEKALDVETLDEGTTVHRIGAGVYAGTACSGCGASYWRCTEDVLENDSLGCCDECRDEGGHVVRILPQVEGLIAEIEQRAKARACYLFEELARKDQALDEIRALHWKADGIGICELCGSWPCDTQRVLAALDAQLNKEDDQ